MSHKNRKIVISEYYNLLSDHKKKSFRDTFLEKTGLTVPSFYYKIRHSAFKKMETNILAELIDCKVDDIYLNTDKND